MGPQFFETLMGRKFYESTSPRIANALEKIAKELGELNEFNRNSQAFVPDVEYDLDNESLVIEDPEEALDVEGEKPEIYVAENPDPDEEMFFPTTKFDHILVGKNEFKRFDLSSGPHDTLLRVMMDGSSEIIYSNGRSHMLYSDTVQQAIRMAKMFLHQNNMVYNEDPILINRFK